MVVVRKIIHIDMDAFFASVEQRDNPELKGKPVAVGGGEERGVVAAASYEARKFGVKSAMPSITAKRLCKDLVFVKPRFDAYKEVSTEIRNIFFEYTDLVEPLSLDEAYLDVTANKKGITSATQIAEEIRAKILEETKLTASAGISINKFLAKTASDINKPNGQFVIKPKHAIEFMKTLAIEKFYGIGKVTAQKMRAMGISNGNDLMQLSEVDLKTKFGKVGSYYYKIVRAEDDREVNPNRERKSIGAENTFIKDLNSIEEVKIELDRICETLIKRIQRSNAKGKTITVKVKYADFSTITRSKTVHHWVDNTDEIQKIYNSLLAEVEIRNGIRLLGITLSNLYNPESEDQSQMRLEI